ncbi:MAG: transcriptional regulator NrdR [Eubacteriaceae bacterium]|nr:transcriptional regulator NrdR [Eubacteriaceae bacterium]
MKCQKCGHTDSKVIDSRHSEDNTSIRRRRECLKCKERFTTYERIELSSLLVIKKDGTREEYNRAKILNGIMKACEKRSVSMEAMESVVDSIERELFDSPRREVGSRVIGEAVMKRLKQLDEVAYVRFASVYKPFKDIESFMQEIMELMKDGIKPEEMS